MGQVAGGCSRLSGIIEIQEDRENCCRCKSRNKAFKQEDSGQRKSRMPIAFDGELRSRMEHPLCFNIAWSSGGKNE